jgi:hypothetical protein
MPAERLPMRKIREVLRLKYACGANDRVISRSVGIGRTAIAEYVRRAAVIGITWPIPEELDDTALERKLFAPAGYNPPRVLVFDQHLHPRNGILQSYRPRRGRDGFGQDIGEAGEKIDVVLIVIVPSVIVDLQDTIRRGVVLGMDDDVDGRDDAVRGVESRQLEIVVLAYIIADRWLPGDERTALWRAGIGVFDRTDDSRLPAVSCFDEKVVLRGTVAAHLGEWHPRGFRRRPAPPPSGPSADRSREKQSCQSGQSPPAGAEACGLLRRRHSCRDCRGCRSCRRQ